jgi:uncharacterized protein YecT (DUF1311 family)
MTGRDRTDEILEVKKRNPLAHGYLSYDLERLGQQWLKTKDVPDFYIVRAVTLLEVFTRRQIAELIDHAKEYTDRAVELSKQIKMDFATVRDVQGRAITLGDIVAHSIPVNSFGQIFSYFETLLGKPLRPLLAGAVDRWRTEVEKLPAEPIIPDVEELASGLSRLFEIRHILCHEIPKSPMYSPSEITDLLDHACRFCKTMEGILSFEKFGLVPLTQSAMNQRAYDDFKKAEEELDKLLSEIRTRLEKIKSDYFVPGRKPEETWLHTLDDAQAKWRAYRDAHCDFDAYLSFGGSIHSLLWAGTARHITKARVEQLQRWWEIESQRLAI